MTKTLDIPAALGLPTLPSTSPDTIAALLWAREVLQEQSKTLHSVTSPNGIEELKSVNIGGVEQWLHIRGRNRNNPVLLWLHGGPGGPVIGCMDETQRPWEDYFTVVIWDQRQTGKSYYPADDEANPLSVQQFIEDTEQLIQYLREYLHKDKLVIVGASWGTALGMHMVKRHPEWIHAYVGVGQVVSMIENERVLYERLLSHADEKNESELVEKLHGLTKIWEVESPEREKANTENMEFVRGELHRLARECGVYHLSKADTGRVINIARLTSPHLTFDDFSNALLGDDIALYRDPKFTKDFLDVDLPKQIGSKFEVPIFFFSGRHDWQTPTVLSDQWFENIEAPHKEVVHFEESSHFICSEEPGKFFLSLANKVLPFATSENDKERG